MRRVGASWGLMTGRLFEARAEELRGEKLDELANKRIELEAEARVREAQVAAARGPDRPLTLDSARFSKDDLVEFADLWDAPS
eukprot:15216729-Alexandrium_andersonii.AAC.1